MLPVTALVGVAWWLLVLVWLMHFEFAQANTAGARDAQAACRQPVSVIPAWAAVVLAARRPAASGPAWALFALLIVWAADTGAYFVGVALRQAQAGAAHQPRQKLGRLARRPGRHPAARPGGDAGLLGVAWRDLSAALAADRW